MDAINPDALIKVMHVDDSAIIRKMITGFFADDPQVQIIATAENGQQAINQLDIHRPDVIILDVEMPVMDGITALPEILRKSPRTKVIMCSTLTERGADISMKALSLGAVECIAKPSASGDNGNKFSTFREHVIRTVKGLFPERRISRDTITNTVQRKEQNEYTTAQMLRANPISPERGSDSPRIRPTPLARPLHAVDEASIQLFNPATLYKGKPDIIAIGSSTGGPQALFEVLQNLKGISIPVVITQHMPPTFTKLLADHIQQHTGIPTHEGQNDIIVEPGHIYVAPGNFHMLFKKNGTQTVITLDEGPPVNFCKPSVDPMFDSLIKIYGQKVLGVILTGMGNDGLGGCQRLAEINGRIIAQNKETCVVWGMPRAVALANICSKVLPLKEIGPWIKTQL